MGIGLLLLIFTGVALVCSAIGFKKFVWFLSVGYGFSVFGLGLGYFIYSLVDYGFDFIVLLQSLLFMIYGFRLSFFLLLREIKNASYRKVLKEATKEDEKKMPVFVMATIWIMVAILYVMQTSPVLFRIYNYGYNLKSDVVMPIIGMVISLAGILIETIADLQKTKQKKENPNSVAMKGLYKMCRCPNYFGEILFWTGVFVGGINAMIGGGFYQWLIAILGYICIVYIMINGSQRLDRRQERRYENDEAYRNYADHTPLIFPLIPVSHIGPYKVADMDRIQKEKEEKKALKNKGE